MKKHKKKKNCEMGFFICVHDTAVDSITNANNIHVFVFEWYFFGGKGECNTHNTADTRITYTQTFRMDECGMCDYTILNLYSEYRVTLEGWILIVMLSTRVCMHVEYYITVIIAREGEFLSTNCLFIQMIFIHSRHRLNSVSLDTIIGFY